MLVSAKAFALKHEMTQGKEWALYSAAVLQSLRPLTVYVRSANMEPKIPIDKASHLFFGRSASVPLLLAHWTLKGLQSWERQCMQKGGVTQYTLKLNCACCPDPDVTNVNPLKLKLVVFDEAAPQMVLRGQSVLAAEFCYKLPVQIATLFQCGFIDVCSSFPVIAGLAIWRV